MEGTDLMLRLHRRASAALPALLLALAACGSPSAPTPAPSATPAPATATPAPTTPPASTTPAPTTGTTVDPAIVTAAVDKTIESGTARIEMTATFEGSSLIPEGTSFGGDGQTTFGDERKLTMSMDMSSLGQGEIEMIMDGTVIYMRGEAFKALSPDGKWIRVDLESDSPAAAAFKSIASGQNDASLSLYYLLGATEDPGLVGDETMDGVATQHLTVPVDLETAIDRVPARVREMLSLNVAEMGKSGVEPQIASDVWVDGDSLIRRVDHRYTLGAAQGGGTLVVEFHLSGFGEPIDLGLPAKGEYVDLEDLVG